MTYKIENDQKKLKLLGEEFVKNNKNKGNLIINNKKVSLKDKIAIKEITKNKVLMILDEFVSNRSCMFKDCESLESLTILTARSDSELLEYKEKFSENTFDKITEERIDEHEISYIQNLIANNYDNKSSFYKNDLEISNKKLEFSDSLFSITNKINNNLNHGLFLEISELSKYNNNKIETNNLFDNNKSLINLCGILLNSSTSDIDTKSNKYLTTTDDISKLNKISISNISNIFYNCKSLSKLPDLSIINTSHVIDMSNLFYNCFLIKSLPDISRWNTDNVINMSGMFYNCSSLSSLPDISMWNTIKTSDLNSIFYNCSSLLSLPDISIWNVSNVSYINNMFYNCKSLSILPDLSKWNTNNLIDMSFIFYNCK